MIDNPARVVHAIVGKRYISVVNVDGEYELAVFKCRISNEKPVVGDELYHRSFAVLEDALDEYTRIRNDFRRDYIF